jgi:hypothetical protein
VENIEIASRYAGPPGMGHGGYVAGLLTERLDAPVVQVTLRRPTPLDVPLVIDEDAGVIVLRRDDEVIAEAVAADLEVTLPPVPTVAAARAAEAGSPSFAGGTGVHPICFGCGAQRPDRDGMRIFVGPLEVDGVEEVAAVWTPPAELAGPAAGHVADRWVVAALDCPGAMAFISRGESAGLLGRIVVARYAPVAAGEDAIVLGWQIGRDGRKLLAGTAVVDAGGAVLAAARATWFGFPEGMRPSAGS